MIFLRSRTQLRIPLPLNCRKIKLQTHKRFKRTLFIRTKHNMQISRVIPFIKLRNDTRRQITVLVLAKD